MARVGRARNPRRPCLVQKGNRCQEGLALLLVCRSHAGELYSSDDTVSLSKYTMFSCALLDRQDFCLSVCLCCSCFTFEIVKRLELL